MKIRALEVEFFHADEQTDMTELIVAFRNFANAARNKSTVPVGVMSSQDACCSIVRESIFNCVSTWKKCDTRWRSWLRHCAASRKVAGSIPAGVTGIFQ